MSRQPDSDGHSSRRGGAAAPAGAERDLEARGARLRELVLDTADGVADEETLDDLVLAARAAWAGGRAACRHYGGELEIRDKAADAALTAAGEADDPVTAADHASNRAILERLSRERPLDIVRSEESRAPTGDLARGRLWTVDPLDGTKEFIAENGEFSVMVGLARDGRAALGAVFEPVPDRLCAGIIGVGAWLVAESREAGEARRLHLTPDEPERDRLRVATSRSHPDPRLHRLIERLGDVEVVITGSVGIKCALVARGVADLYVHPVPFLKEWDTCAPEAVLRGAGGEVTDCAGRPLTYGKEDPAQPGGILAASAGAYGRVRDIVRETAEGLCESDRV